MIEVWANFVYSGGSMNIVLYNHIHLSPQAAKAARFSMTYATAGAFSFLYSLLRQMQATIGNLLRGRVFVSAHEDVD